jgi:hypothetical protein
MPSQGSLAVFEVYITDPDPDHSGCNYTVVGNDGRQYDTLEHQLEAWVAPVKVESEGFQAMQEEFRKQETLRAQQMAAL